MPLIPQSRIDKTFSDPTPLFAAVGAGDLALAKLREARDSFDAQTWREQAQAKFNAQVESLRAELNGGQGQVMDLPVRLQAAVADAVAMSATTYSELATRGRDVVARVRHQPSTDELQPDMPSTVDAVDALQPDMPSTVVDEPQPETPSAAAAADVPPSPPSEGTTGPADQVGG